MSWYHGIAGHAPNVDFAATTAQPSCETKGYELATRWFEICEELDPRLVVLVFEMDLPMHQRALRSLVSKVPIEVLREILAERERLI